MTLTAAGYDGGITEADWASISNNAGAEYAVGGATDFQVTPRTGATLTSNVAAGVAYGAGVKVTNDAQITVAHATAPSSGTRWDAVVLRRDWAGTGGTASVVVITGTATRAVPAGRFTGPGVKDDQVLALVPINAGQSIPGAPDDYRVWPSKVLTVSTLQAITNPRIGMEAVVLGVGTNADTRWRYQLDPTSNPTWERDSTATAQRTITALVQGQVLGTPSGWDGGGLDNQAVIDGNHVDVWVEIRRESARLASDANGATAPIAAFTLTEALYPPKGIPYVPFTYYGGAVGNPAGTGIYSGWGSLTASGVFTVIGLTPNIYMNVRTGAADISMRAHFSFTRKVPN